MGDMKVIGLSEDLVSQIEALYGVPVQQMSAGEILTAACLAGGRVSINGIEGQCSITDMGGADAPKVYSLQDVCEVPRRSPATPSIVRRFAVCRPVDTDGMSDADIRAAFGVELGICLSAEHLICQERAIGLASNSAADRSGALGIEAVALLRLAGITYVAWLSSR